MSAVNGPSIVNNGIVLQLDADNIKSYPGTGTIWTDLSDQDNHGSIQAGVTYNSQGWFDFNGASGYVNLPTTAGFAYGTAPGTICGWARTNTITGGPAQPLGYSWIFSYGVASRSLARFIGIRNNQYIAGGYNNDIGYFAVLLNTWFHLAEVYDGTTAYMYLNSVLVASEVKDWNTIGGNAQVGRQVNGGEFWNGSIAQVQVYNRGLTADEIFQNFSAHRGRYGV